MIVKRFENVSVVVVEGIRGLPSGVRSSVDT